MENYRNKSVGVHGGENPRKGCFLDLTLGGSYVEEIEMSDSENTVFSHESPKNIDFFGDTGLIRLKEEDEDYKRVKSLFIFGMGLQAKDTHVVAVHKNSFSGLSAQARLRSFAIYADAAKMKCPTNGGNIKLCWYGTSKDEVSSIINQGFVHPVKNTVYGFGICLSPRTFSIASAISSTMDEDGLRHVLVCDVILGNIEEVIGSSVQSRPSSKIFDSGVDDMLSPKTFIVWSSDINTHILPKFVISFKTPTSLLARPSLSTKQMAVTLIDNLSALLPPDRRTMIRKAYDEVREKKLPWQQLKELLIRITGVKLLNLVAASIHEKQLDATTGSLPNSHGA